MVNKSLLKSQFIELTGVSTTTAGRYLDIAKYDLAQAIDHYFTKHPNKAEPTITKVDNELLNIYNQYSTTDEINIDGTLQYLEDLQIQPENFQALVVGYLLKAPQMGKFDKDSFLSTWSSLKINNISRMRDYINLFESQSLKSFETFKPIYQFAFKFAFEQENQKILDIETCIDYWNLLIPRILQIDERESREDDDMINERIQQWYKFLHEYEKKSLTCDSWTMFYSFFIEIVIKDAKNFQAYDEMAAWPSIIDEYIEYLHDNELLK